jgi:hypothetical protein
MQDSFRQPPNPASHRTTFVRSAHAAGECERWADFVRWEREVPKKPLGMVMAILLLWLGVASAAAPDVALDIRLYSGTTLEQRGREQLIEILKTHNLEKWLFTRAVVIQSRVIPHSHPVLTLNTRHLDDNVAQLATLLHEQLHWFITDHVSKAATEAAMQELRRLFPHAPTEPPMGARGERSTYLHLIICYLELEALSELLGVETARSKLATWDYYTWVYAKVLTDTERIREIVGRHIGPVRTKEVQ